MKKRLFNQQSEPGSREAATAQRLSVKARIMMALFALMLIPQVTWAADYPIYVGESSGQLTSENQGTGAYAGMSYSPDTYTLTLNGANLNGCLFWADYSHDLTIVLKGTNSIKVASGACIDCQFGSGSSISSKIIFQKGDNNCQLNLESVTPADASNSFIYSFAEIVYGDGLRVITPGQTFGQPCTRTLEAIYLTVAGQVASKSDFTSSSTYVFPGYPVTYDHTNKILTLDNAFISYSSGNAIVYALNDDLTVKLKGANTIDCGSNIAFACTGGSVAVAATVGLTFETTEADAGGLTMLSTNAGFSTTGYYSGFKTPTYKLNTTENLNVLATDGTKKKVTISFSYGLSVGTVTVNSANASNVLAGTTNDGKISYSHDATNNYGTLTLDGVTLDDDIINKLDKLTIHFKGTNKIGADAGCAINSYQNTNAELVFDGEVVGSTQATLIFNGNDPFKDFKTVSYASDTYLASSRPLQYTNGTMVDVLDPTVPPSPTITTVRSYPLWIGNSQVTENYSNSNATFTPDNGWTTTPNYLTISNLSTPGPIVSGLDKLTIKFSGTNSLTGTQGFIMSTRADAPLTFNGVASGTTPSTLTLNNSEGTPAVQDFSDVLYNGAYLTSNNACGYNTGLVSMRDVEGGVAQSVVITTEAYYPLWVNSTQVKYGEESDILDYNITNNKASFDGVNTLTLEGVSISNSNAIESFLDNLTINLKGENLVEINTGDNPALCSGVGTASLTIVKDAAATGDVSLLLKSVGMYNTSAIQGFSSITYTDTPTTYTVDDSNYPYNPDESVSINYDTTNKILKSAAGSVLSAVYFTSGSVYDLWVGSTRVMSANSADVLSDGTVSYVHDATNNTGTLTLDNAQLVGDIATSMSNLTIHIKGGCEIRAKSNCIRSSATTPGILTFTREGNGELTLNNINAVDPYNPSNTKMTAIKGFKTLAGLPLITKEPYEIDAYCRLKKSMSSDTATIDYAWVNADVTYPLWVNGNQVTSENKTNVLEAATPTVTFDGANTLTLDGANISDSIISDLASLTIGLIGDNRISKGIRSSKATTSLTIAKDATATGNVSLLVETPYAYAIWGFNSLTYTGFTPYTSDGTIDLTSTISYTSTDRVLKDGGSKLDGVKFVSKTDLSASGLSFSMDSKTYSGSAVVLPGNVTMNDGTNNIPLTATSDYTVTGYKDANGNSLTSGAPTDAGSYYATISGEGVYMGTADVPFTINPITASLSWDTTTPLIFNGTPQAPAVSVSNLLRGESCTVTVIGQETNAGTSYTATATALSNNNYQLPKTGLTQTFKIDPVNLSTSTTLSISTIDNQTYSGSEIKPTPAVKIKLGTSTTETPLVASTDFDYSYSNNTNAALSTAASAPTVTITGKGNYEGTKVVKFTIDPLTATLAWSNTTLTYNGSPQQPTAEVSNLISPDVCTVTVTGAQTNAGDYTATAISLSNTNYQLPTTGLTQDFTIKDRTANITFNAGQTYKTFYSAGENLLVPNDVKAYVVTMVSGNTVNLTQISYIHSNVPVLLESSSGATTVKDPNESLPATNLLKYASAAVSTDGTQYVLYSGEFVKATGTIPAGKVYLTFTSPVRTLTIDRNNSATAIEAIFEEAADGEQWYDMQGRKINKPTKDGLYIKNGKKVVVNNK